MFGDEIVRIFVSGMGRTRECSEEQSNSDAAPEAAVSNQILQMLNLDS